MRLAFLIFLLLASSALAQDAAPEVEFSKLAEAVQKSVPNQELVDRLYAFMEKWPRDGRGDQVQFWVGQVQQKRKFHHEAVKEFGFVIKDFPNSPLLAAALREQAQSHLAIDQRNEAAECFRAIIKIKPANPQQQAIVRDALLWLADRAALDEAVGLLAQLPDQRESVQRIVGLYIRNQKWDEAVAAIDRLKDTDRLLMYNLQLQLFSARPGVTKLFELQEKLFAEPPRDAIDELHRNLINAIGQKGQPDRHKALENLAGKSDRLRRWAAFNLCEMDKATDVQRLSTFVGDYRTGGDVEQCKLWIGEYHEAAGNGEKARQAYKQLADVTAGHFRIAETYYGPRAKTPDLNAGEKELSEIVKRFYSAAACCDALTRRADLQAGPMKKTDAAVATLRELIDRFPGERDWSIRALMRLGQLLRSQKKQDEAIAAYDRIIVNHPQSGAARQAWLEVAGCYEEKADRAKAIETYRTVLRKFPRTGEASRAHTILETKYKIADTDVSDR